MLNLSKKNGIALDAYNPFIVYNNENSNIPKGFVVGRTYPNYVDIKKGWLSETLMSQDVLTKYLSDKINIGIIDTKLGENDDRPDTATTANDAAKKLVENIIEEHSSSNGSTQFEYHVSFHSNQPYIDRQTLTAQKELNKVLKEKNLSNIKILLDGVGFSAKEQCVAKVHSELGASFLERYKNVTTTYPELISSRDLKDF